MTVLPKELPGSARSGMAWQVRVESAKPMDLLVMENVFYERSLAPVYDLKGSERARWCKDDPADPTTVLLDENLKRDILSAPLLVRCPAVSENLHLAEDICAPWSPNAAAKLCMGLRRPCSTPHHGCREPQSRHLRCVHATCGSSTGGQLSRA